MSKQPEKKQRGTVNYFRVIAGGYLIYLAYQLFKNSNQSSKPAFGLISAVAFVIAGAWVLWVEWKAYKYGVDHIDDPESWNEEEDAVEDEELERLMESTKSKADACTDEVSGEDEAKEIEQ